jgi:hypothetical protein
MERVNDPLVLPQEFLATFHPLEAKVFVIHTRAFALIERFHAGEELPTREPALR